jgi:hypothetical protein
MSEIVALSFIVGVLGYLRNEWVSGLISATRAPSPTSLVRESLCVLFKGWRPPKADLPAKIVGSR